jgi:hypothetical protein
MCVCLCVCVPMLREISIEYIWQSMHNLVYIGQNLCHLVYSQQTLRHLMANFKQKTEINGRGDPLC